jgi:predicted CXXCH cytochrome family protein
MQYNKVVSMRLSLKRNIEVYSLVVAFYLFLTPFFVFAGVGSTKHNLSVSGPGPAKATSETEVCKFCHTPHNSDPAYPLWNHQPSAVRNYTPFVSETLKSYHTAAEAPPVDGISKLCLGCHDGTIALGALVNKGETVQTVPEYLTFGMEGYLGTDLSGGHPISIIYDQALVYARNSEPDIIHLNPLPITDKDVKLYPTQGGLGVQCTSCHDPHGGKGNPGEPPFWQKRTYDEVCLVCHDISQPISTPGAAH